MGMVSFNLVPTASALDTSTGSFHFFLSKAKSAPQLAMPPRTPGVNVRLAWWRILCLASFAAAMFPPASAYLMGELSVLNSISGARSRASFLCGRLCLLPRRGRGAHCRLPLPYGIRLKQTEQSSPADAARMHQRIGIRKKTLENLPGVPGARRRIERHVNHHRRADQVLARHPPPKPPAQLFTPVLSPPE